MVFTISPWFSPRFPHDFRGFTHGVPPQEEMVHLNNVDRPGSDVDAYVNGLDRILRMKAGDDDDVDMPYIYVYIYI